MAEEVLSSAAQGAAAGTMIAPGVGTVIGGALGALGGFFGSKSSAKAAEEANIANLNMMREQQVWQHNEAQTAYERTAHLLSTAHQREMEDLARSGLNPILSAKYGGASGMAQQASGVSSHAQVPVVENVAGGAISGIGQGLGSALEAINKIAQVKLTESEARKNEVVADKTEGVDTALVRNDIELRQIQKRLTDVLGTLGAVDISKRYEDVNKVKKELEMLNAEIDNARARLPGIKSESAISGHIEKGARVEGEIDDSLYGRIMRYIDRTTSTARSAAGLGLKMPSVSRSESIHRRGGFVP
ncbi:MAG: DNA pilot protein [Microviridae sp.]|nr:MAG: DNA pilot protein [Microviridae sp.]